MLCEDDVLVEEIIADAEDDRQLSKSEAIELSRHSLTGINTSKTLKLHGTICSEEVIVLVDSVVTYSFLLHALVNRVDILVF